MTGHMSQNSDARADFYKSLVPENLAPLWEVLKGLVTKHPISPAVPAMWRYDTIRPYLMKAGELITAKEAERRVLILENPAMQGMSCITHTLYAGLQLILPGEIAPAHRHTQSALRFIMEGDGAYTAVGGERAYMKRWDLIITPSWTWHDHGNDSDRPMVWLDGLDIPLIRALDASFAETLPDGQEQFAGTLPTGDTRARYGANLRPARGASASSGIYSSLFVYPHEEWRSTLERLKRSERWDPHEGLKMEFQNPANAGPVMPTISAFCQFIPQGFETQRVRSTDGMVFVVTEGTGRLHLGDTTFDLAEGDIVVVPSWQERRFSATGDLVMFSFSDKAVQEKLGLWREQLL